MRGNGKLAGSVLLTALVVLAAMTAGCDTTAPAQVENRTVEVTISAANALVRNVRVWEMFEDDDGNMLPDDVDGDGTADVYRWCEAETTVNGVTTSPTSLPWEFSAQISVIRAGHTEREVLTSSAALSISGNLALDDTYVVTTSIPPHNDIVITDNGVTRRFRFDNFGQYGPGPRRHSIAHPNVLSATSNPLSTWGQTQSPAQYGLGAGLCSPADPGPPSIDGQDQPYTIPIGNGDTVIVEVRRGGLPPALNYMMSNGAGGMVPAVSVQPLLTGSLYVDGVLISNVNGEPTSTSAYGSALWFSYTTR